VEQPELEPAAKIGSQAGEKEANVIAIQVLGQIM
jgi:hypothetical protein